VLDTKLLGQILVDNTELTQEQLEEALKIKEETGEFLGKILVNMGYITETENQMCLGMQWGVPFIALDEIEVDHEAATLLPQSLLKRYKMIPIAKDNGKLTVAMVNPIDVMAIDQIRLHTNYEYEVEPVITTEDDVMQAINDLGGETTTVSEELEDVLGEMGTEELDVQEKIEDEELSLEDLDSLSGEPPIVRLVNMLITRAVKEGVSDIHLQPEDDELRVRYRADGVLRDVMSVPKAAQPAVISRVKVMADMKIDQKRAPQDGRISLVIGGKNYDFRVSSLPGANGEKIVMRILDKATISLGLSKLGMSTETLQKFEGLIGRAFGIVLVTGPTGSGKTVTLYSALQQISTPEVNVCTAEDPVEFQVRGLTQANVNERAGMTFPAILRTFLRQDPDIILVGEIRDGETAKIATEAALTGHLVLSTLHTNDSCGALPRLIEMGVEPFLVSSSVIGVLAQRLVRRICPHCKERYAPPKEAFEKLGVSLADTEGVTFYKGKGCDRCHDGYRGRIGIYELLTINDTIRDMILREAPAHEIRETAIKNFGLVTLKQDAISKVLQGITTIEEALRVVHTGE